MRFLFVRLPQIAELKRKPTHVNKLNLSFTFLSALKVTIFHRSNFEFNECKLYDTKFYNELLH